LDASRTESKIHADITPIILIISVALIASVTQIVPHEILGNRSYSERAVIAMEQQVFLHYIKDFFQSNFAFLKRVFDPGIMLHQFLLFIFLC
jgi:hypothetical protein